MENDLKRITAVLGPTNTGKTHLAVETMLEHKNGIIGLPLRLLAREIFDKCVNKIGPEKVALITDGRFSGATRGFCIGHVGPEASVGGPIALLRNGDIIDLDAKKGTINVRLTKKELAKRRKKWKPKKINFGNGTLWKYAQTVGPAYLGAPTHPGGKNEVKTYADI